MRSSFRSSARCALTCALGALAAWLACGEGSSPPPAAALAPLVRLADPEPVAGGLSEPAGITTVGHVIATIADETRFAMAAPRREVLVWNHHLEVPRSRRIEISAELTGSLEHAKRLVVFPYLGIWRIWEPLPLIVLEPETSPDGQAPRAGRSRGAHLGHLRAGDGDSLRLRRSSRSRSSRSRAGRSRYPTLRSSRSRSESSSRKRATIRCNSRSTPARQTAARSSSASASIPAQLRVAQWQDRSVSLERLAGQTRRFRFRARRLAEAAPFSFPVWGNPTVYAARPRSPSSAT